MSSSTAVSSSVSKKDLSAFSLLVKDRLRELASSSSSTQDQSSSEVAAKTVFENNALSSSYQMYDSEHFSNNALLKSMSTKHSANGLHHLHDVSTTEEHSHEILNMMMEELPEDISEESLDAEVEKQYTVQIQKKRERLFESLKGKRAHEIILRPHQKVCKVEMNSYNPAGFRGSKFRGISKNGSSW